tara:strand:+ start:712 stop:1059 length:348 start_codon:yes stop_codon:yes gene_type:complete
MPQLLIWVILTTIILLAIIAITVIKKKGKHEPDYRGFATIGFVFFAIGMGSQNPSLWTLGLVFLAIGLANKDKWKPQKKWSQLSKQDKNLKIAILIGLTITFIAGVAVFLIKRGV